MSGTTLSVQLQTLTGQKIPVTFPYEASSTKIVELKYALERINGVPPHFQRLVFNGRELQDEYVSVCTVCCFYNTCIVGFICVFIPFICFLLSRILVSLAHLLPLPSPQPALFSQLVSSYNILQQSIIHLILRTQQTAPQPVQPAQAGQPPHAVHAQPAGQQAYWMNGPHGQNVVCK